jgi:uncharacterized protein with FMN-binding domain
MRRFIAVFVATVAGLVILLSFKTVSVKGPLAAALSTPGDAAGGSDAPGEAPASSALPSASTPPPPTVAPTTGAAPTGIATATPSRSASKSSVKPSPSTAASVSKVVTGVGVTAEEGRRDVFGVVTVQLTIKNGKIVAAAAVTYPRNDPHSSEISSFAIPQLNQEVLAAQGAGIDAVSGATITSNAYAQSLQSALDKAKA